MTKFDMPVEDNESNSSLSLSSNEIGPMSNRSMDSSISNGSINQPPPPANQRPRSNYNLISLNLQSFCQEPTLDAVLVYKNVLLISLNYTVVLKYEKKKLSEKSV